MMLDRPITAFQNVVITTSGAVDLNDTIDTSATNSNVTINAGSLALGPMGSINAGSGVCSLNGGSCSGSSGGLPAGVDAPSIPPENVLVAATDEGVTVPAPLSAGAEDSEPDDKKSKSEIAKKPVCTGSGKGQAGGGVSVGGFSRRCTSRGCS